MLEYRHTTTWSKNSDPKRRSKMSPCSNSTLVSPAALPRSRAPRPARTPRSGSRSTCIGFESPKGSSEHSLQSLPPARWHELADVPTDGDTELFFGPEPPADERARFRWIQTIPGNSWFVYFRIYGPEEPAFDGTWQLLDFEPLT